jgi:hypothetical protein
MKFRLTFVAVVIAMFVLLIREHRNAEAYRKQIDQICSTHAEVVHEAKLDEQINVNCSDGEVTITRMLPTIDRIVFGGYVISRGGKREAFRKVTQ